MIRSRRVFAVVLGMAAAVALAGCGGSNLPDDYAEVSNYGMSFRMPPGSGAGPPIKEERFESVVYTSPDDRVFGVLTIQPGRGDSWDQVPTEREIAVDMLGGKDSKVTGLQPLDVDGAEEGFQMTANEHNPEKGPVKTTIVGALLGDDVGILTVRILPGSDVDGVAIARSLRVGGG